MLDARCWRLEVGRWMLDVGCWMLEVGCWMLEVERVNLIVSDGGKKMFNAQP